MDLTIPYTFYPSALPHWLAWVLFSAAILGGGVAGTVRARDGRWASGLAIGMASACLILVATAIASMAFTFFLYDA